MDVLFVIFLKFNSRKYINSLESKIKICVKNGRGMNLIFNVRKPIKPYFNL